jgi:head-tail adaptor
MAGRIRTRLHFEARVVTAMPSGSNLISWITAFDTWGQPERLEEQSCRFTIRYRAGIGPDSHRIFWSGAIWTIVSAVHDLRRTQLVIECDFSNLIEATHLLSTESEHIDAVPVVRPRD